MRKFSRRLYENTALLAVRQQRTLVLFWARRCRKSTTLGSIAFDEMSGEAGRTVIAASASLLLGTELVGMTATASEQAAIVLQESTAMREVFDAGSAEQGLDFQCANAETGKVYQGMTAEDFAALYKSSRLEMRLYHDKAVYSRLKIIAPNPATARGWAGTVLRDEAGYTPARLETDLQIATKPITDTDPTFKIIYASNLCPDDRHPFFEMTLPGAGQELPVNAAGNFYRGQTGCMVHRVTLQDAYAAGHVLYDDKGKSLTYAQFVAAPGNKLGRAISYDLVHESGGSAAIDLMAMLTSQQRGARKCAFCFIENEAEFSRALELLRDLLTGGKVGVGVDVATTTSETSNPTSVTVTEMNGVERIARLVVCWKEKKPQVARDRLRRILTAIASRRDGGPARRMCIDGSNERYFAEETKDELVSLVPCEVVVNGSTIEAPGYDGGKTNYKTYLGDVYSAAVNENKYALPSDGYIKADHRMVAKDRGVYVCEPEPDGKHGDTFDSGKLAEYALSAGSPAMPGGVDMNRSARAARQGMSRQLGGVL